MISSCQLWWNSSVSLTEEGKRERVVLYTGRQLGHYRYAIMCVKDVLWRICGHGRGRLSSDPDCALSGDQNCMQFHLRRKRESMEGTKWIGGKETWTARRYIHHLGDILRIVGVARSLTQIPIYRFYHVMPIILVAVPPRRRQQEVGVGPSIGDLLTVIYIFTRRTSFRDAIDYIMFP